MRKLLLSIFTMAFLWSCSGSKNAAQLPKEQGHDKSELRGILFGETYADAAKEKILGNYEASEKLFQKALDINPNSAPAHYELGNIYSIQEKPQLALEQYEMAVKSDKSNYWFHLSYGTALRDLGQSEKAIEEFTALIAKEPKRIELKYELAQLLLNNDKKEEGLEVINQIEEELGVTEEVSFLKQRVHLSNNEVDAAAAEIQKLIDTYPNEIKYYGALADTYALNGRKEEALKVYEKMQQLDSTNYKLQFSMAEFYRQEGENEKHIENLSKAFLNPEMDIDEKIKYVLTFYDVDSRNKEQKQDGIELCRKIALAHPENAKSFALLADFQYFDNQIEAAKQSYITTISLDSSRFPVWNQLIFIFADQGDTTELVDYSRRAIELFPNQPTVYLTYGIGLSQQGDNERAIEYLELGKDLVLDNPSMKSQFYSSLGDAYHEINDHVKSDKNYDQALSLDPKNIIVLNNYSYYISLRDENLEKAKKMSAKSNNLAPNQASFQDTYAWILFQLKEYENAKIWIDKAIDNSSDPSAELLEHKGDILFHLGELEEAVEFWKRAKKAGSTSKTIDKKITDKTYYE